VCWVRTDDLEQLGLKARLLGADRLYAVATGAGTGHTCVRHTAVLIADDTAPWLSWNVYAEGLAPRVYWTWSLVWRRDESRSSVLATVDTLTGDVGDLGIHRPDAWLPEDDPYRR
jgi:hypothetical protein